MATHSCILAGERQNRLMGYSPWSPKGTGHNLANERTQTQTSPGRDKLHTQFSRHSNRASVPQALPEDRQPRRV